MRSAGYRFIDTVQYQATQVQSAWHAVAKDMPTHINAESDALKEHYAELLKQLRDAEDNASNMMRFMVLSKTIGDGTRALSDKIEASTKALNARFEGLLGAFAPLTQHLRDVAWSLQQFGASGIELGSGEAVFIASKAEWAQTGKDSDDPDGFLCVTNQRIIFEQSEKKGKFLGMFGGKKVQAELWSVPLAQLTAMTTERKGIIGGKAMLTLTTSHTDYPTLTLEIKGGFGNERMKTLPENAQAGNFGAPLSLELPAEPVKTRQPITRENVAHLKEIAVLGSTGAENVYTEMIGQIVVSANGGLIATRILSDVRVWETASGKLKHRLEGNTHRLVMSADGSLLALVKGRTVEIVDTASGTLHHTLTLTAKNAIGFNTLEFSPDGKWAAAMHYNPLTLTLYHVQDWSIAQTLPLPYVYHQMLFSRDSQHVWLSTSQEINPMQGTHIYDTRQLDLKQTSPAVVKRLAMGSSEAFTLSPDETLAVIGREVIELASQEPIINSKMANLRTFSADSTLIFVETNAPCWVDIRKVVALHMMPAHDPYLAAEAISADGTLFVTSHGGVISGPVDPTRPHSGLRLWAVEV